jgi:hypothetical protein
MIFLEYRRFWVSCISVCCARVAVLWRWLLCLRLLSIPSTLNLFLLLEYSVKKPSEDGCAIFLFLKVIEHATLTTKYSIMKVKSFLSFFKGGFLFSDRGREYLNQISGYHNSFRPKVLRNMSLIHHCYHHIKVSYLLRTFNPLTRKT